MAAPLQAKELGGTVTTPAVVAFDNPVTSGSVLVIGMRFNSSVSAITVVDSVNGAWTQIGTTIVTSGISFAIFYVKNAGAGTTTVTITPTGASAVRGEMAEYGGMDTSAPLDKTAQNSGTSTTPSSGATGSRSQANEVLFGFLGTVTGGATPFTAGSGYTLRLANAEIATQIEDQTVSAAGTDAATFTLNSSDTWACFIATFKLSGGASTGVPEKVNLISYVDEPYQVDSNYALSLFAPSPGIITTVFKSRQTFAKRLPDPNEGDDWLFLTGIIKGDAGSSFTPSVTNVIRNRTISIGFGSG